MFTDKNIPNLFTCLNLLCGCIAIVCVFHGNLILLVTMIFLASMFDFLDGLIARSLNAYSEIGKQLDSLADMVTFGVVPGMILFQIMINRNPEDDVLNGWFFGLLKYFPFIVTVFAAFRLAKFNLDTKQGNSFIGLPSPAMGILVTSFPLIINSKSLFNPLIIKNDHWNLAPFISNQLFIISISIILSVLMVSKIKLFALKFKSLKWNDNKIQFIFLIASVILFSIFLFPSIPMIIFLYIILSVINNSMLNRLSA
ncbi:MAG: CDP-alcohol phosphatidyltransferase family protein [Bacteroidia bacterium]